MTRNWQKSNEDKSIDTLAVKGQIIKTAKKTVRSTAVSRKRGDSAISATESQHSAKQGIYDRLKPKYNIKKGDTVVVIAGDDKDIKKPRTVLKVLVDKGSIVVEGVNIINKPSKSSASNTKGGRVEKEAPIHISNVRLWDEKALEPLKIKREREQDRLVRIRTAVLADIAYKPENQMTAREKMDIIRTGVSKKDLEGLKEIAKLDYDELAKSLSVTRATLINKKREEKFNAALSERILALADIYSYGYEVFEDEARFNQWMFRPNHALGGQPPFELMDNQFGREEVRNIIGRIDYGVYS